MKDRTGVFHGARCRQYAGPSAGYAGTQGGPSEPRPQWKRDGYRRTYGAIDLGTNNCRLLVARPTEGGFTVIDAFSRIVRLGEGLSQSGRLSTRRWTARSARFRSVRTNCGGATSRSSRSVATEACRRAANGREFTDRVRDETGIVARHHRTARKKRGSRCSVATSCSSPATVRR